MKNVLIYWTYYIGYLFSIQFEIMTTSDKDEKSIYKNKMMVLKLHHSVGQRYDGKYPYFYHLKMVAEMADKFSHILSKKDRITAILIALWHDAIEDCRLTYNDLVKIVGVDVADGVYACTELRGRNRKERHGPEYLKTLQESRLGTYGKISDIAANMTMGKRTGSRMFPMYTKEFPKVKKELYREEFKIMFDYIENDIIFGYNFSKINKESKLWV